MVGRGGGSELWSDCHRQSLHNSLSEHLPRTALECDHLFFSALRSNLSRLNRSRLGTRMMQISAAVKPPLYRQ